MSSMKKLSRMKKVKKADLNMKTLAIMIATFVGIVLLVIVFYRVIFQGGILG